MAVDTQASHPSKPLAPSSSFTNVIARLLTEEQLCDIEPWILYTYFFTAVHNFLFPWYALMYNYQSNNDNVKLNSALKNTDSYLKFGTVTCKFMCKTQDRRKLLLALLSQISLHTQKNIMEHWPAPCSNSNDYCCFTYGHKIWQELFQTSIILPIWTQGYNKGPWRWTADVSEVLLPQASRRRISLFSDASSHLLTNSNKSPHYYML